MGDMSVLITNFNESVGGFYQLLNSCFYLIGGIFAVKTGWEIKSVQESRGQHTYAMAIVTFLTAVIFLYLPTAIDAFSNSMFDGVEGRVNPLAMGGDGTTATFSAGIRAIVQFVELVGLIAFGRGWFIMRALSQGRSGEGAMGRGITHMVGGILAVNITTFAPMLAKFVGLPTNWMS